MFKDNNFIRTAAAVPVTEIGNTEYNIKEIKKAAEKAAKNHADIVVFPELSVTSYTCGDLFRQKILVESALDALNDFKVFSSDFPAVFVIGLPLKFSGSLYNCAAVVQKGEIYGIVPKTYIPNNNEFYESRWFASSFDSNADSVTILGSEVPFKPELIFQSKDKRGFTFSVEICEDLWAVIPPSSKHSLAGAEIILNLSSSNEIAGKAEYRRDLVKSQSGRSLCGYVYTSTGAGESTTDTVYGGHSIIGENRKILAENIRFNQGPDIIYADIDLDIIRHERMNSVSFSRGRGISDYKRCYSIIDLPDGLKIRKDVKMNRYIDPFPFVPGDRSNRIDRCEEILNIQSSGLASRLKHTGIKRTVIGLSGGLDSTLALLVTIEAYRKLNLDFSGIYPITMPGFGTSNRTKGNVYDLCREMNLSLETISIVEAVNNHLKDIGHNGTDTDITYENSQARERTQILMDKANLLGALVIGTGDLSELALGWCTYNGDHMSMYAVNSGVPKTLVSYLIEYYMEVKASESVAKILKDIINTPISPELLPLDSRGEIVQKTEDNVGPYSLHDFFLYHVVRFGFNPEKVLFLAKTAFRDKFTKEEILKWLKVFYRRFFSQQFKRSAIPDGPKVGTIALSPRADWRMPSDASVDLWQKELDSISL